MRESARFLLVFSSGTVAGLLLAASLFRWRRPAREEKSAKGHEQKAPSDRSALTTEWACALAKDPKYALVQLQEWTDMAWRKELGWHGRDLCHNPDGRGVRILQYYFCAAENTLTGVVHFGVDAESHRGLCHGGSMTSLMDDVLGWLSFFAAGRGPWDGCTVSVSVQLKKPVKVGSLLKVVHYSIPRTE
jgi:hypothetical protein